MLPSPNISTRNSAYPFSCTRYVDICPCSGALSETHHQESKVEPRDMLTYHGRGNTKKAWAAVIPYLVVMPSTCVQSHSVLLKKWSLFFFLNGLSFETTKSYKENKIQMVLGTLNVNSDPIWYSLNHESYPLNIGLNKLKITLSDFLQVTSWAFPAPMATNSLHQSHIHISCLI